MNTDYKKILEMAIGNEIEAYEFYTGAVSKSQSDSMKTIFRELAEEEMKHKKTLEGFLHNEKLQFKFHESHKDYKVSEATELPALTSEMSFAEGVALAMKKEQEAMEMYQQFADASMDGQQKEIFSELAKMELGHKVKLEELYNSTAHNEVW
jgi:rubrerythrin